VQGKTPQAPHVANVLREGSLYPWTDGGKKVTARPVEKAGPRCQCAGAARTRTSLNCLILGEARNCAPKRALPWGSKFETLS
jgi:hypothetical protein